MSYMMQNVVDHEASAWIEFRCRITDDPFTYRSPSDAVGGPGIVSEIFKLPGVEEVDLRQHGLTITKAPMFSWGYILQQALEVCLADLEINKRLKKLEKAKQ